MSEMKNENKKQKKLTATELSRTLGDLDSKYIDEAERYKKRVSPSVVRKFSIIAAAALLCVTIILGTIGMLNVVNANETPIPPDAEPKPESIWEFFSHLSFGKKDPISESYTSTSTDKLDAPTGLYAAFDMIRADAEKEDKLTFAVENEKLHYELKASGEYDDSCWLDPAFIVIINCDYDIAANEDWYKECVATDDKSLNAAFYDKYGTNVPKGDYTNIIFLSGMYLQYYLPEDFCSDFAAIKAFADLDYVTSISISYHFSIPIEWLEE